MAGAIGLLSPPPGFIKVANGVFRNQTGRIWKEGEQAPGAFSGPSDDTYTDTSNSAFKRSTNDPFKRVTPPTYKVNNQG